MFIYFYQKNQILIITSISGTLTKELEIMSLTEIFRDDAVQPCASTPTSSGTLPPPPPPPPLPPKQIKPKPVRSLPCKPRTPEGRIDDTVQFHSATKSSPPAMHPDIESKQKEPKKPKSGNPLKKIFSKK